MATAEVKLRITVEVRICFYKFSAFSHVSRKTDEFVLFSQLGSEKFLVPLIGNATISQAIVLITEYD